MTSIPDHILNIPGRQSAATHQLVFKAMLSPMTMSVYYVTKIDQQHTKASTLNKHFMHRMKILTQHNETSQIFFKDKQNNKDVPVDVEMLYYKGHRGNNSEFEFRASGAYIFRPDGDTAISLGSPTETTISGPVYDELIRSYPGSWVTQSVRLYHDVNWLEVAWNVGPIPVNDGEGKEVIARFCSSLSNDGVFYTDSNGRQLVERKLNFRPDFEINMTEPVAQNYYPVNSKIIIQDATNQMGVLTDRSQAGSSLDNGCIELMVHRRLLDDDAFGVGEALNEVAYGEGLVAVGKHVILIDNDEESFSADHRLEAMNIFHEPLIIFGNLEPGINFPQTPILSAALPDNIHILTLKSIQMSEDPFGKYLFLQLEHIFQSDEHSTLSSPVDVNLETLFELTSINIEEFKETTLGGNMWIEDLQRLTFNKESNNIPTDGKRKPNPIQWSVTLNPMDIRSFIIKYN